MSALRLKRRLCRVKRVEENVFIFALCVVVSDDNFMAIAMNLLHTRSTVPGCLHGERVISIKRALAHLVHFVHIHSCSATARLQDATSERARARLLRQQNRNFNGHACLFKSRPKNLILRSIHMRRHTHANNTTRHTYIIAYVETDSERERERAKLS